MKSTRFLSFTLLLIIILFGASVVFPAPFKFVTMADSRGSISGVNDIVLSSIIDLVIWEDAEFVLFPGDLVMGSSDDIILSSELDYWRSIMDPIYSSGMYGAKVYAGPGNHEIRHSGSEAVWQTVFSDLPLNGPAGETFMTYSYDYMNAHFIMLNTNRAGNSHTLNYDWLANDLASTSADHIFVFGHEPAYPLRPHVGSSLDYYPSQRDDFWQLLVDYGVDIYFAGHEHLYNHIQVNGVHQVITGTSGAPIYSGYGGEFYHYALITVDGPDVSVDIIDDSGVLRDSFALAVSEGIPPGAVWKYRDDGTDQGMAWSAPGFDDSVWASGVSQLGYGDGDEVTTVYCGPSAPLCNANNFITTYFRHSFEVTDASVYDSMDLKILRDDGAVVYINGTEVLRSNMPGGAITHTTPASSVVGSGGETAFYENTMDSSLLVNGTNIVAVEVHQFMDVSSDISFNLELLLNAAPVPDLKANSSDGPIILAQGSNLTVSMSLDPGGYEGDNADWWIFMFYYNPGTGSWVPFPLASFQSPLVALSPTTLLNTSGLPAGLFAFFYGVDLNMNGIFDNPLYSDIVVVTIQ